jgi:sugar diacid utilization regulator
LIPDPSGPGRRAALERAVGERAAALGPAGDVRGLPAAWGLARDALRGAAAGALPAAGLLAADEHLVELLILGSGLDGRITDRALAPFDGLTEKAAARMRETAFAYVRRRGNSVAMAAELHVHPQTARYRIARLRELLGERLEDPDARFELELALRARALRGDRG